MTTSGSSQGAAFARALRAAAPALRRELPWIGHGDPWAVLVSEVMLQQTSTGRVLAPWRNFLARFPTPSACADAALSDVLRAWRGLGYHRRAKALHDAATMIRDHHAGEVPRERAALRALPGVGEYTAAAVASFAFGERVAVVDTNVGRVLARAVANRRLRPREARDLAEGLLPRRGAAGFNQALLDLGAQHCRATPRCATCPLARRCAWRREGGEDPAPRSAGVSRPQAPFAGSDRQLRGRVLDALRAGPCGRRELSRHLGVTPARRDAVLDALVREGLVARRDAAFCLAD